MSQTHKTGGDTMPLRYLLGGLGLVAIVLAAALFVMLWGVHRKTDELCFLYVRITSICH